MWRQQLLSNVAISAAWQAQLLDYAGVEYAMAAPDGEVISEFVYGEMKECTGLMVDDASALSDRAAQCARVISPFQAVRRQ